MGFRTLTTWVGAAGGFAWLLPELLFFICEFLRRRAMAAKHRFWKRFLDFVARGGAPVTNPQAHRSEEHTPQQHLSISRDRLFQASG